MNRWVSYTGGTDRGNLKYSALSIIRGNDGEGEGLTGNLKTRIIQEHIIYWTTHKN
jgi:hypothetical protein